MYEHVYEPHIFQKRVYPYDSLITITIKIRLLFLNYAVISHF